MTHYPELPSDLVRIIHDVRKRWRMKLALRGAAIAAACVAATLVGSAMTLQWMRFTPDSILLFRVLLAMVAAVVAYLCVVRPLVRSVSDEQVALYLEEHEPSLEAAIISAVEVDRPGQPPSSPALVRKLVQNAVEKVLALEDGRRVERNPVRRYSGALGGVFAIAVVPRVVVGGRVAVRAAADDDHVVALLQLAGRTPHPADAEEVLHVRPSCASRTIATTE